MGERNSIFYDLEGPISSQDNARAVCKRYVKDGQKLFPVISRYDDLLTLDNREGYEPGNTLALIVPFLVGAEVTEDDIRTVSAEAGLVPGIREFFTELKKAFCPIWIISTSYKQHALSIAKRVGLSSRQVYCTSFQLDTLGNQTSKIALELIRQIRERAVKLYHNYLEFGINDEEIRGLLDSFYWEELPRIELSQLMAAVKVIGGRRKVKALEKALGHNYLDNAFVVVDSITDFRMAQVVEAAGGIALAWNANWYVLPWCSCGIAAVDARAVKPVFQAWREGGRAAVRDFMESAPEPEDAESGPYYHWLAGREEKFKKDIVLPIHKRLRITCRGAETAKLG